MKSTSFSVQKSGKQTKKLYKDQCKFCGQMFASENFLKRHMWLFHTQNHKVEQNKNNQAKNEQTSKQSEENSWMKSTSFSVQKSGKRRSLNEDSDNDWHDSYVKRKYFSKE